MGFVEDELKQLKDVISNLDSRIKQLEQRATGSGPVTTQDIRMILIGPPGAGMLLPSLNDEDDELAADADLLQEREPRLPRSKSAFLAATSLVLLRAQLESSDLLTRGYIGYR